MLPCKNYHCHTPNVQFDSFVGFRVKTLADQREDSVTVNELPWYVYE